MSEMHDNGVELPDRTILSLDKLVARGAFKHRADAISFAIYLLGEWLDEEHHAWTEPNEDEVLKMWAEAEASGPAEDVTDEWFEDVKRRGREKLAAMRAAAE